MVNISQDSWSQWIAQRTSLGFADDADSSLEFFRHGHTARLAEATRLLQIIIKIDNSTMTSYEIFKKIRINPETKRTEFPLYLVKFVAHPRAEETLAGGKIDGHARLRYHTCDIGDTDLESIFQEFQQNIPIWFNHDTEEKSQYWNNTHWYELAFGAYFLSVRYRWTSSFP